MSFETRRIDCLIAAELSLTCGARALRELSACLRGVFILVSILVRVLVRVLVCILVFIGDVNCLARNSSGKNECDSSRNSNELQISHVSILSKDSDGICKIYSPSLLMMVDFESLKYGGYVVLLC